VAGGSAGTFSLLLQDQNHEFLAAGAFAVAGTASLISAACDFWVSFAGASFTSTPCSLWGCSCVETKPSSFAAALGSSDGVTPGSGVPCASSMAGVLDVSEYPSGLDHHDRQAQVPA
jgi:hypothetical protein